MYVEIGAEAAQFPEKEYRNGIAVAVWVCRKAKKIPQNTFAVLGTQTIALVSILLIVYGKNERGEVSVERE
jgi:hypothetical protein